MENYKYIKTPISISFEEIKENNYCFAPSKYSRFTPNKDLEYMTLDELITESVKKTKINKNFEYKYSEIGDINVENGFVDNNFYYGINMPSGNPKTIQQHDIVISTVRTYRGGIGYITDGDTNQCCSPAMIVIRDVKSAVTREYLFAILRNEFFIEQVLGFLNRGMYPRLDKESMKHIVIPIPKEKSTLNYITVLVKAYLNKIKLIKERHQKILALIEKELLDNQKDNDFSFNFPTIKNIENIGRLDASLYSYKFQQWEYFVKNYAHGYIDLITRGFSWARGTSLEKNFIGSRIDSDKPQKGFYELVLPTNISQYGYVEKSTYIGTPTKLKTIKQGDIIFGGEGFGKGRTYVVIDESNNVATNYHGIRIINNNKNLVESIFIRCFLAFWREKGMIDAIGVGGSGGHCSPSYFSLINTPYFPESKQQEIAKLYHNPIDYPTDQFTLENFEVLDNQYNEKAGIYELDKSLKLLKRILNNAIESIIDNNPVKIVFK